jgi:hypothetical protein
MSLLNVNLAILAYADAPASATPLLRLADLKWSMMGLPTDNFRNIPLSLAPGETATIASTARPITVLYSSGYEVSRPEPGVMRITGNLGQRIGRLDGSDETTEWSFTKTGDLVRATHTGNGTAPSLPGSVWPGDGVTLDSPFGTYNQGDFTIVSVSSNHFEFLNPVGQEETVAGKIRFYTSGPVQKGDILDISSETFSYLNRVTAPISRVNDQFIEVPAQNVVPETVTQLLGGVNIYPNAYKWLLIAVDHKAIVGLNGEVPTSVEVEPYAEGDLTKQPGLFMKRGKVFEVRIKNPGLTPVQGFVILAE